MRYTSVGHAWMPPEPFSPAAQIVQAADLAALLGYERECCQAGIDLDGIKAVDCDTGDGAVLHACLAKSGASSLSAARSIRADIIDVLAGKLHAGKAFRQVRIQDTMLVPAPRRLGLRPSAGYLQLLEAA